MHRRVEGAQGKDAAGSAIGRRGAALSYPLGSSVPAGMFEGVLVRRAGARAVRRAR